MDDVRKEIRRELVMLFGLHHPAVDAMIERDIEAQKEALRVQRLVDDFGEAVLKVLDVVPRELLYDLQARLHDLRIRKVLDEVRELRRVDETFTRRMSTARNAIKVALPPLFRETDNRHDGGDVYPPVVLWMPPPRALLDTRRRGRTAAARGRRPLRARPGGGARGILRTEAA
jgi:hypothetical protein